MYRFALSLAAALAATTSLAEPVGMQKLRLDVPHHDTRLSGAIWFPAAKDGWRRTYGQNGVWRGNEVVRWARPADGSYPVILLSHGMGGNIRSHGWLGIALAARGAIVVSVNHPNSSTFDFDLEAGLDHWTRAQDFSAVLDHLLTDSDFADRADVSRVMAAGFSYGGWTALSLAGVRGNVAGYASHCAAYAASSSHCQDIAQASDDLQALQGAQWDADYSDPRISHVAAIDPAFMWGLEAADVADVSAQVTLIGLGAGDDRLVATDFDAGGFVDIMPQAQVLRIAPASHYMALPLCQDRGAEILANEGDDPVCTDPAGADRAEVHAQIIDQIARDLGL